MSKFLVLGAGKMGIVLAKDLILSSDQNIVTLVDVNFEQLESAQDFIQSDRLIPHQRNVGDKTQMDSLFGRHDVVVAALLHEHSLLALEAAVRNGVHLVDLVGDKPLERLAYEEKAEKKGISVIPGCGVAPGIDNICVGRGVYLLDETEKAIIYVGGNPLNPQPPLNYSILYAVESLLELYERKTLILSKGKKREVETLSGIESISFPHPFSRMECFYTDGLSSLPYTMQGKIRGELAEKTIRFPGHAWVMKTLRECGLFSREPIYIGDQQVIPREFLKAHLESSLKLRKDGDVTLMRVVVSGKKSGQSATHVFEMVDFYDSERKYTSMAKTTSFPASIAAQMIASGKITQRGVLFPENVFHADLFHPFLKALKERGVIINHKTIES